MILRLRCVVPCVVLAVITLTARLRADDEPGFQPMFNGHNLDGWKGTAGLWSAQDGMIVGKTTAEHPLTHNTFLVWQGGKPKDFELRLTYRIVGGNSGVQYRSHVLDDKEFIVGGYQADIEAGQQYTGINYEERGRGILAERGQRVRIGADGKREVEQFADKAKLQDKIRHEDWNDYVIIVQGPRMQHIINGVLMSEVIDEEQGKASDSGVIALQLHQGQPMTFEVKNMRIKELK